jgi:hypothetical protein
MRSSISAQSWLSVPPAPGWMVTMALRCVVLAGEQHGGLEALQQLGVGLHVALDIGGHASPSRASSKSVSRSSVMARMRLVVGDELFQALAVLHHLLALPGLGPEVRSGDLLFGLASFCFCAGASKIPPHGQGLVAEGQVRAV